MKGITKRFSKVIIAALLIAAMFAMNAFAAAGDKIVVTGPGGEIIMRYSEGIILEDEKPSLTIYKYEYNGKNPTTGNGHYTDVLPEGAVPLEGVVFTYCKIADLVQTTDGQKVTALKYNVSAEAAKILEIEAGQRTTEEVTNAIEKINASGAEAKKEALEAWVKSNGTAMPATGEDGKSKAENLAQGLYLLAETTIPAIVSEKSNPFLVSLPMTNIADVKANNKDYAPGTLWQYDVIIQPKNKVERPEIDKNIVEEGDSDKYGDLGIGDTVTYQIRADIPHNIAKMKKYNINDKMSAGLTFQEIKSIKVGQTDVSSSVKKLIPGTDGNTFTLRFIHEDGNALQAYPGQEVIITYTAILNENAIVTEEGNPNNASLTYNHNSSVDSEDATVVPIVDPKVYTYGIDLQKVDEKGVGLAGIEFEIYRGEEKTPLKLTEKLSSNAAYKDIRSYYVDKNSQKTKIITGADGKAYVYGLAPGIYYLKETKAAPGHDLLPNPIKIVIKEDVTYTVSDKGTYLQLPAENVPQYYRKRFDATYVPFVDLSAKAGTWVNFGTNQVYLKNGEVYTKVSGLCAASVKASASAADPFGTSGLTVLLKVQNDTSFQLPKTGGVGTYMFVIGGIVIALAAAGLIVVNRKKRMSR